MRHHWIVLGIVVASASSASSAFALTPGPIYCAPDLNGQGVEEVSCSNVDQGGTDPGGGGPGSGDGDGSSYAVVAKQINAIYQDVLGRNASVREVYHWWGELDSGEMDLEMVRLTLSIANIYWGTLERVPQGWEIQAWVNNLNGGGWTLPSMRHAFTQTQECGNQIVSVYQERLGRTPATWEVNAWRDNLDVNGWTLDSMFAAF